MLDVEGDIIPDIDQGVEDTAEPVDLWASSLDNTEGIDGVFVFGGFVEVSDGPGEVVFEVFEAGDQFFAGSGDFLG